MCGHYNKQSCQQFQIFRSSSSVLISEPLQKLKTNCLICQFNATGEKDHSLRNLLLTLCAWNLASLTEMETSNKNYNRQPISNRLREGVKKLIFCRHVRKGGRGRLSVSKALKNFEVFKSLFFVKSLINIILNPF